MSEVEKQESQKTVVAFITGLLIGGLLVWVFSSTPEDKKAEVEKSGTDTEQVADVEKDSKSDDGKTAEMKFETIGSAAGDSEVIGKGAITVVDQKSGDTVALGALEFPTKSGWVVVREFKDNVAGNVLGAARYNASEGLTPSSVSLMRATVAGAEYQVVFFTNMGSKDFSLADDKVIEGAVATFKAQ